MQIDILMENRSSREDLLTEHGFSCLIAVGGQHLLFDTGASGAYLDNANRLGADPGKVGRIILSHAHYDHAGGLPAFVGRYGPRDLVIGPGFFRTKGKKVDEGFVDLGPGWAASLADGLSVRVVEEGFLDLEGGVYALGGLRAGDDGYFAIQGPSGFIEDDFREELSLVIRTREGLVVLVGCAHCGIEAILGRVDALFPGERVALLLGGLHLSRLADERVCEVGKGILHKGIGRIGLAHCSGGRVAELLPEGPFFGIRAGDRIVLRS